MRLHGRHGWGYDASLWAPLARRLGPIATDDRGYYGPPRADPVADDEPYLLIGHSLGSLRMLAEAGSACRGLIAINGFDRFVGDSGSPGVPPRLLDRMQRRCATDPAATVVEFRARLDDETPLPGKATERLTADLRMLGAAERASVPAIPMLRLDGAMDPLLLPAHRDACFPGVPRREVPAGGHLLPISDPDRCADAIRTFIGAL